MYSMNSKTEFPNVLVQATSDRFGKLASYFEAKAAKLEESERKENATKQISRKRKVPKRASGRFKQLSHMYPIPNLGEDGKQLEQRIQAVEQFYQSIKRSERYNQECLHDTRSLPVQAQQASSTGQFNVYRTYPYPGYDEDYGVTNNNVHPAELLYRDMADRNETMLGASGSLERKESTEGIDESVEHLKLAVETFDGLAARLSMLEEKYNTGSR